MGFIKDRIYSVLFGLFFIVIGLISPKAAINMLLDAFRKVGWDKVRKAEDEL